MFTIQCVLQYLYSLLQSEPPILQVYFTRITCDWIVKPFWDCMFSERHTSLVQADAVYQQYLLQSNWIRVSLSFSLIGLVMSEQAVVFLVAFDFISLRFVNV